MSSERLTRADCSTKPTGKRREATVTAIAHRAPRPALELPTLLIALAAYGGWIAITLAYRLWPLWVVAPTAIVLLTLHSSLQHEIVHGHPTRWPAVNRLIGIVPLSFWLPFDRYRQTHLQHHIDARLTDPYDDPESFYWTREDWARLGPISRASFRAQQTLAGRMVIGSFWVIGVFFKHESRRLIRNEKGARRVWLEHLLWCIPVILWVQLVCGIPLWIYLIAMVIPANGVLLIRSFAEHRARPAVRERIALVERSWVLGPLFLFNSLHALHHEAPMIPWYAYHARYRLTRERLLTENGGLLYRGYFDVARRFLFRAHDDTVHPTDRVPRLSTVRA